jgi:hypothetical protein
MMIRSLFYVALLLGLIACQGITTRAVDSLPSRQEIERIETLLNQRGLLDPQIVTYNGQEVVRYAQVRYYTRVSDERSEFIKVIIVDEPGHRNFLLPGIVRPLEQVSGYAFLFTPERRPMPKAFMGCRMRTLHFSVATKELGPATCSPLIAQVPSPPTCNSPLPWVLFTLGSSELSGEASQRVAYVAAEAKNRGIAAINVVGFADLEREDVALAQRRAEVVKAELIRFGFAAKAIISEGKGWREPYLDRENDKKSRATLAPLCIQGPS